MTVVGHANWWCSTCGARGSGNGAAYTAWLRGHACGSGLGIEGQPAVSKPERWYASALQPRHQTVPGTMTFTVLEKG